MRYKPERALTPDMPVMPLIANGRTVEMRYKPMRALKLRIYIFWDCQLRVTTQAHEGIETQHPWEQEIIRRLAAYQLHRNLTSPWFAPGCPHCVFLL